MTARHRLVPPPLSAYFPNRYTFQGATVIRFREAALIPTSLLAPVVGTLLLFLHLDAHTQAAWNAVAVAVAGLVTAALVARDRLAPAILGLAQAVIALLDVYSFGLTAAQSTGVMSLLALVVGAYVRTQVQANVTADGQPVVPAPAA